MKQMMVLSLVIVVCLLTAVTSAGAAPNLVSYQARLTSADGTPVVNGSYSMTFRIYDAPSAGVLLWSETQPAVAVNGGLFTTVLGGVEPLPDTLLNGNDRFLEVQVGTEVIAPRSRIISQPYSLRVSSLEGAAGGTVTSTVAFPIESLPATGNAIIITDSTGQKTALSISANVVSGARADFYDPVDSKDGKSANQLVVHLGSDGARMYDPAPEDSTVSIKPDGRAWLKGPVQIGDPSPPGPSFPPYSLIVKGSPGIFVESASRNALSAKTTATGAISNMYAIEGVSVPLDGFGTGGWFWGGSRGVLGYVEPSGDSSYYAVEAMCAAYEGSGDKYALKASAWGVSGKCYGVVGLGSGAQFNYGVYGAASGGVESYAGSFSGDVQILGTLTKTAGSFKIDHPLDPANKYLSHSFVESPDMMNVYNGNATTDADGFATVELPSYFEALNRDFRYQLTVLGQFAQAIVAQKVANNRFVIQTDKPEVEVSWQVTGIRQDAYANAHRIAVEEDKRADVRGLYIHPEDFGLSADLAIDAKMRSKPANLARPEPERQ